MARNLRLIESLWRYGIGGNLARFRCNLTRSVYLTLELTDMNTIVAFLVAWSVFTTWVVFFGGAETLEGKFGARIFVHYFAHRWKARTIKVYVGGLWFGFVVLLALWEVSI